MKKREDLFATPDKVTSEEQAARKRAARQAMCERLCANADFKEWLYGVLDDFCAFEFGYTELDAFTQGIRASADILQSSLLLGENGVAFLAELKARYLQQVRANLMKKHN